MTTFKKLLIIAIILTAIFVGFAGLTYSRWNEFQTASDRRDELIFEWNELKVQEEVLEEELMSLQNK